MLGKTMAYSCANFNATTYLNGGLPSLDDAQNAKLKQHYVWAGLNKLKGVVLDCGCGWGSFERYVFGKGLKHNPVMDALTVSMGQAKNLRSWQINDAGVSLDLLVYLSSWESEPRDHVYSHFVSIGMLEHVGIKKLPAFFDWVADVTTDDMQGSIQFISSADGRPMDPWFDKHIFPGAEPPTFELVKSAAMDAGFVVDEAKERGIDYFHTLKCWHENLFKNERLIRAMSPEYDDEFFRMFDLYLQGGMAAFAGGKFQLWQVRLVKEKKA